jgi:hypothetical protein
VEPNATFARPDKFDDSIKQIKEMFQLESA